MAEIDAGSGLVYVNDLCTCIVVNNKGGAYFHGGIYDPAEIASLSLWVLQYKATVKEADRSTDNRVLKAGARRPKRISPRGATRDSELRETPTLL